MELNFEIISLIVILLVIVIALYLNKGKLNKLALRLGLKGVSIDMTMGKDRESTNAKETKPKVTLENIKQEGNRDKIDINSKEVSAKDINQVGEDNEIKIG